MLAGISIDEVIKIIKSNKWQASISKILETLDYFGYSYNQTCLYSWEKGSKR